MTYTKFIFVILIVLITLTIVKLHKISKEMNTYKTIPKIVHQIYLQGYNNIPEPVKKVIHENKVNNPGYDFRIYDYVYINEYVKNYTTSDVYEAFKLLNHECYTCLSDFFRYIIVYNEGGIYMDIKAKIEKPLREWVHNTKKIQVGMWPWDNNYELDQHYTNTLKPKTDKRQISNSVFFYPPKHPVLKNVITNMVNEVNIKHKNPNDKQDILNITGPHLYTRIVAPNLNMNDFIIYEGDQLYDNNIKFDGTDGEYYKFMKNKGLHWSVQKKRVVK